MSLPIEEVLPQLLATLRAGSRAVLIAPPGAGKTTMVAPALLHEGWCEGQVWLLSPRRIAARAAAERIAEQLGEPVGGLVGYATRLETRQSPRTRLLVLTEGIFRNRIQSDPELSGISAVLFDEVHERSLDSDFGLALALDVQGALRPDLRLLAMSATLDGERLAKLMDGAPLLEAEGRSWPLDIRYRGRKAERRIEQEMADAVRAALAEESSGDVLAFLPGVSEINRTADELANLPAAVHVLPLHGALEAADQRRALKPAAKGERKVILATSIAETSLTIDGVHIVIDSGLARRPRYDRAAGVVRLVTERASQAAATQRAGRAARQGPGVAYRLWAQAATQGLPPFDPPEILESDLSALLLDCALWGVTDPASLRWLDPPPAAAVAEARQRLTGLGALDESGHIMDHGRRLAALPLEPRLGHMLAHAAELGLAPLAAEVAVLLGERGLGSNDTDLSERIRRWRRERGGRADSARRLAQRWTKLVSTDGNSVPDPDEAGVCIALAFPDRIARRRGGDGADWISVGGRAFRLDPASPLARAEWLAVAEVQGASAGARILSAAPITLDQINALYGDRLEIRREVHFSADTGGVQTLRTRRLGAIMLSTGSDDAPDPAAISRCLMDGVRVHGLDQLPWPARAQALRRRAAFAGEQILDDAALLDSLEEWLLPLLDRCRRLSDINPGALHDALLNLLGWDAKQRIDRMAPEQFETPAGTHHAIDYAAHGGPEVEVRVQALYGLAHHPCVGSERIPLRLSLTSPAGRPIQTTSDLPGFWAGSWKDVAKEMRGRYPRHNWPDDPTAAPASLRTKKAQARS